MFSTFSSETLTAAIANGFTHFSSQIELDHPPYPTNQTTTVLYHFPIGTSTNDADYESYANRFVAVPGSDTYSRLLAQYQQDGFSVVMMVCINSISSILLTCFSL